MLGRLLDRPRSSIAVVAGGVRWRSASAWARASAANSCRELDEGALWLQVQMPTGLSLDKASEMASELRRAVLEFPEVSYVVTQIGRSDDGTDRLDAVAYRGAGRAYALTTPGRRARPRRTSSTS